ncbi:hypothetical protein BIW11_04030 [Tropilaelaps mercedesae]|uniref:Uncharacterized protein n=1 Tax=Tropilaelaps mercedesae TaxID=418985 RepID=A0A1V9XC46_9ACAR|nr:hypothetical protein BIW11_04030 [Tropilaelaps mercedesae]
MGRQAECTLQETWVGSRQASPRCMLRRKRGIRL